MLVTLVPAVSLILVIPVMPMVFPAVLPIVINWVVAPVPILISPVVEPVPIFVIVAAPVVSLIPSASAFTFTAVDCLFPMFTVLAPVLLAIATVPVYAAPVPILTLPAVAAIVAAPLMVVKLVPPPVEPIVFITLAAFAPVPKLLINAVLLVPRVEFPLDVNVVKDPADVPPVMSVRNATVPDAFWNVTVLAAVGSVITNVVLLASAVAPSKTNALVPWIEPVSVILPDAVSVVNDPVLPEIGEFVMDVKPASVPPVNAIFEPVTEFPPWATVPPKVVVPLIAFVPVALPIVLAAVAPAPNVFVKPAPVPIVEFPVEVSVVNEPAPVMSDRYATVPDKSRNVTVLGAVGSVITKVVLLVASAVAPSKTNALVPWIEPVNEILPDADSVVNDPVLPEIGEFVMDVKPASVPPVMVTLFDAWPAIEPNAVPPNFDTVIASPKLLTSPVRFEPERFAAVVAVVAVAALPVMLPAMGFVTVKFARVPTDVSDELRTVDFSVAPVSVLASAVTVMFAEPSKDTPLMVRAVRRVVAVVALPVKFAVIVVAMKLPLASRLTIEPKVLAAVAALARFAPDATFAAVTPLTLATVVTRLPAIVVTSPDNAGKLAAGRMPLN